MILLKIAHLVFKQVTYSLYQVRMFLPLSWWEQFTFILVRTIYLYLGENNLLLSWWEQFTFILVRTIYFYLGENNLLFNEMMMFALYYTNMLTGSWLPRPSTLIHYYTPALRRGRGVYCFTSVRPSVRPRYFSSHFSQ
jgi:hypothetical protein